MVTFFSMFNPEFSFNNGLYQDERIISKLISYEPLWKTMADKGIATYALINNYGISSRTIHNLKHTKGITVYTLERLCEILDCTPNDVIEFKK